jgi:hypothetical protein
VIRKGGLAPGLAAKPPSFSIFLHRTGVLTQAGGLEDYPVYFTA